ncbi:hypothetical protein [Armatimonas sp.]|uniref:hypothetical protein n=1 Tax=Armatimonas sp. TaxID=1872638 RepID=UPI00374C9900
MSAEFIQFPTGQNQKSTSVDYGDMPHDAGEISELIKSYATTIKDKIQENPSQKLLQNDLTTIGTLIIIITVLSIIYFIFGETVKSFFYTVLIFTILFLFIGIHETKKHIKNITGSDQPAKIHPLLEKLILINSLASAMLQSESTLKKGERLLLELRSSEADEAIIAAQKFLMQSKR